MSDIRDQLRDNLRQSRIQARYDLVERIAIQLLPAFVPPPPHQDGLLSRET